MQDTCFDPSLQQNKTFLEVYNCNNERPPRKDVQPAEKAVSIIGFFCSTSESFFNYDIILTLSNNV